MDRAGWESRYGFSYQTVGIASGVSATSGLYIATANSLFTLAGGDCGLVLDNKPSIDPGVEHINTPKASGLSQENAVVGRDFIVGKKMPTVQLVQGYNKYVSAIYFWLLLQKGVSEGGAAGYIKTAIPYASGNSGCEVYANISQIMDAGTSGTSYSMTGAICNSIQITGEEGGRMVITSDWMGHSYIDTYDHSASDLAVVDVNDELFFNYGFTLDGTTISLKSFDVTVINNAVANFYTEQLPQSYSLGMVGVSGNIKMSMADATIGDNAQIDNFIAGTDILLVGTYTSNNILSTNMKYNGPPNLDPAEETLLELAYTGVYDGTNNAIEITATDAILRNIPA